MQIHFIWIKEFNSIKEVGVNLSSKFLIHLDKNGEDYLLTIKDNPDYILDFFKEKNITNVSAIIGKNGVGKSSILKYIKNNLPKGLNGGVRDDMFVYSDFEGTSTEQYHIAYPESIPLKIIYETSVSFKEKKFDKLRFSSRIDYVDFIYYNYLLEFNEDYINFSGLQNISTSSLLLKERKRILEENQPLVIKKDLLTRTSDLDFLHMLEVSQAVVFITKMEVELPFKKPKSLRLNIDLKEDDYFVTNVEKDEDVKKLLEDLYPISLNLGDTGVKGAFVSNLLYAVFINFLITERKYSVNNPYFHTIDLKEEDTRDSYITRFFTSMKGANFLSKVDDEELMVGIPKLDNLSYIVPQFINLVTELIEKDIIMVKSETEAFFNLGENADQYFKSFQYLYIEIKGITSFLQFRWHSLSAGEQSYLSFMSRFYSLFHEESIRLQNNLIILIDEGDVGYHPEWQRMFFKNTIQFLSALFHDKKIQLIITSNTPFLTSDLPKPNVLFVEKSEDGRPVFHDKQNHNANTFAANIHTLFSDSFYMNGMLIGEYAKDKINEIIKYINDESITEPNYNYKKIIDSIGEQILRKKLLDMWFEKFGLAEKLEILKREVAEIEQKIKNKNDTGSL
ncbi:hypothetical protein SAMN02927916_3177 [Flavobacterium anhuiense]|uniref:ATPase AAA-type core domain-containing protein n=1 Tax=Flavobacterium anhuiense TaxID=459526 RepID=A0ABY0LWY1_9FLAO|nr:ATP-binding protein [Flavobacterium anhuiense]SCY75018.1 hypothetical protein SAMN02927916_3177 [Flavobacterium anhuiense]